MLCQGEIGSIVPGFFIPKYVQKACFTSNIQNNLCISKTEHEFQ